jgi:hypothetical protein
MRWSFWRRLSYEYDNCPAAVRVTLVAHGVTFVLSLKCVLDFSLATLASHHHISIPKHVSGLISESGLLWVGNPVVLKASLCQVILRCRLAATRSSGCMPLTFHWLAGPSRGLQDEHIIEAARFRIASNTHTLPYMGAVYPRFCTICIMPAACAPSRRQQFSRHGQKS